MTHMKAKLLAAAGVAIVATLGLVPTDSGAQERVRWKMQSAFPGNLSHLGTSAKRLEAMVERVSGGNFTLKFFEPGALVPALECFDAASKGSVESCFTTAGYHTGKHPSLAFFTAVPFGPGFGEYFAWMIYGGGKDLQNEIYARSDLYSMDCNMIGPETSGWFKKPVELLDQLKGLKMRFFGLGAQVMQKMGVSTQLLAGADIYPALERGVIDATEFSMPNMDIDLGFYQVAKYNYYPGWHQQSSIGELLMNKAAWEALDDQNKAILRSVVRLEHLRQLRRDRGKEPRGDEQDAAAIWGDQRALDRRGARRVREGLERSPAGAVGSRPGLQEDSGQLPRVPQALQHMG